MILVSMCKWFFEFKYKTWIFLFIKMGIQDTTEKIKNDPEGKKRAENQRMEYMVKNIRKNKHEFGIFSQIILFSNFIKLNIFQKEYVKQLEAFREAHPELSDACKKQLNKSINNYKIKVRGAIF